MAWRNERGEIGGGTRAKVSAKTSNPA